MHNKNWLSVRRLAASFALVCLMLVPAARSTALGSPDPQQSGSVGLEASISAPPPTQAATIVSPSQGQTFTSTPITVTGFCKTGLLVKIFSNNVFVGSTVCVGGSYSLKIDLFSGQNDLVSRVYDSLDQSGPDSAVITVRFNDASYAQFGSHVNLTSTYARKGANPGSELLWPIVLSGGKGPYALSVDWGDNKGATLYSEAFPGNVNISHVYDSAGIYNVIVKATDANGANAYLQLVGIANGQASTTNTTVSGGGNSNGTAAGNNFMSKYGWYVMISILPLVLLAFWLGSRHELFTIRRRIERSRQQA